MLPQKRGRSDSNADLEKKIHEVIRNRKNSGIWTSDVKKEVIGYSQNTITKAITSLKEKNFIKEVTSVKHKGKKIVMAVEFEPAEEISGGGWYQNGALDIEFIDHLREHCLFHIKNLKIATCDKIWEKIRASPAFMIEVSLKQVSDIVELMVLDNEVEKLSAGNSEFSHVSAGRECFRVFKGGDGPKEGALSSIPCCVCPRISECTPDGVISPITCVYYNKWLGIDF